MKKLDMKRFAGPVLALSMLLAAAGCGGGTAAGPVRDAIPEATPEAVQDAAPEATPGAVQDTDQAAEQSPKVESASVVSRYQNILDLVRRAKESKDAGAMASVEYVARLADLESAAKTAWGTKDYVDVDDDHNPYDFVWTYGSRQLEGDDFGNLYAACVDACDWSLVFDAEYYKQAFPVLATLYHEDDDLLLEHFQTAGVHEGRQGCEGFNVSAYMENCSEELSDAFGDASVCYYFYYMLNHDAEKTVDASNEDGEYPLWRTVELTSAQQWELDAVNAYRAEAGADPVEPDPKLMALANYRAWANAQYRYEGHDWIDDHQNECYQLMRMLGTNGWSENMVGRYSNVGKNTILARYATNYKNSESHYEAMVNPKFHWFGVAHVYRNLESPGYLASFDVFSADAPKTSCTAR